MDTINIIDFILHMDKILPQIIQTFGIWTYLLLFLVIFMETGFVVTPFLPGDSLLFTAGAFAALFPNQLNVFALWAVLFAAAFLGDTANYWIGHFIGPRAFSGEIRFLKKSYLDKTQAFYEKYGGKTIFLARFVPIIRTFAGYFFGNLPFVKDNFSLVVIAIVIISVLPAVYEYVHSMYENKKKQVGTEA